VLVQVKVIPFAKLCMDLQQPRYAAAFSDVIRWRSGHGFCHDGGKLHRPCEVDRNSSREDTACNTIEHKLG